MKITAIKAQVKRSGRYSIFVDGKYSFSLSEAELLHTQLAANQELTQQRLAELKDAANVDKAFGRALNLLARRPRSEWELRDYLKRKEYGLATSAKVILKLEHYGYIDDLVFAKLWVENRRLLKPTSKRRLQQELRQKRIDQTAIDLVLADSTSEDLTSLRQVVAKKRARYPDKQKLMQYLARQGYSYHDVQTVLDEDMTG